MEANPNSFEKGKGLQIVKRFLGALKEADEWTQQQELEEGAKLIANKGKKRVKRKSHRRRKANKREKDRSKAAKRGNSAFRKEHGL